MAQMGIHMAVGLIGARTERVRTSISGLGFLIGNIFPDIDFLLLIPFRFINRDFALQLHRSATHSIILVLLILILGFIFHIFDKQKIKMFLYGASAGILVHIFLDFFMWFNQVDFLWPLDIHLDLYKNMNIPDFIPNIVASFETACYAILLLYIQKLVSQDNKQIVQISIVLFFLTLIQLPFALITPAKQFEVISYGVAIIVGFSYSSFTLLRYRKELLI